MTYQKIPRVAVVGVGAWGKNLVRNFNQLGALKAVCSEHFKDTGDALYEGIPVKGWESLLDDATIDGIVIATPTPSHSQLAREAIGRGKHVFVEKPLAETSKEAYELLELAKKANVTLMVGHLLRYHPCFEKLLVMVQEGDIGCVNHITLRRCNFGKFRAYESILRDFAPHDLSMLQALLGNLEGVEWSVSSHGPKLMPCDDQLSAGFVLGGVSVNMLFSRVWPIKEQLLVVQGSKGCLIFDDTKPWDEKLKLGLYEKIPFDGEQEPVMTMESVSVVMNEPLKDECSHFLDCIGGGEDCRTPAEHGAVTLAWMEAMEASG